MVMLAGDEARTRAATTACDDDNQVRQKRLTAAVIDVRPLPGGP